MDIFKIKTAIICNNDFSVETLNKTFEFFISRGFINFIFLYEFDFDLRSPAEANRRIKDISEKINLIKPNGISVKVTYKFIFSDSLKENSYLADMISKKDRHIFLQLPVFYNDIKANEILNYLLYKEKLQPIFVDFDRNIITCDDEFLNTNIFKSTAGVFAFEFNFLMSDSEYALKWIDRALKKDIRIFPCFSADMFNYAGFDEVLYNCKRIHEKDSSFDFWRRIKATEKICFNFRTSR